jgi:hypothetical protein
MHSWEACGTNFSRPVPFFVGKLKFMPFVLLGRKWWDEVSISRDWFTCAACSARRRLESPKRRESLLFDRLRLNQEIAGATYKFSNYYSRHQQWRNELTSLLQRRRSRHTKYPSCTRNTRRSVNTPVLCTCVHLQGWVSCKIKPISRTIELICTLYMAAVNVCFDTIRSQLILKSHPKRKKKFINVRSDASRKVSITLMSMFSGLTSRWKIPFLLQRER